MLQRQIRFVLVATMIANEVYFVMGGKGEITVDAVILSVCFECIIDYKIIDVGILISSQLLHIRFLQGQIYSIS